MRIDGCQLCRYNALLSVPYQLEQFLLFGLLICLDSFLVGPACLLGSLLWKNLHEQLHASSTFAACCPAQAQHALLLMF